MKQKFPWSVLAASVLLFAVAEPTEAKAATPGLGVAAGVAIPDSNVDFSTTLSWGFFVDIPLTRSFQITPSTILYHLQSSGGGRGIPMTDVSLNFKFVVPLSAVELFFGATAGITAGGSDMKPHLGAFGGLSIRVVSNLDAFAQLNYRLVFEDPESIRNVLLFGGPRFRF